MANDNSMINNLFESLFRLLIKTVLPINLLFINFLRQTSDMSYIVYNISSLYDIKPRIKNDLFFNTGNSNSTNLRTNVSLYHFAIKSNAALLKVIRIIFSYYLLTTFFWILKLLSVKHGD